MRRVRPMSSCVLVNSDVYQSNGFVTETQTAKMEPTNWIVVSNLMARNGFCFKSSVLVLIILLLLILFSLLLVTLYRVECMPKRVCTAVLFSNI